MVRIDKNTTHTLVNLCRLIGLIEYIGYEIMESEKISSEVSAVLNAINGTDGQIASLVAIRNVFSRYNSDYVNRATIKLLKENVIGIAHIKEKLDEKIGSRYNEFTQLKNDICKLRRVKNKLFGLQPDSDDTLSNDELEELSKNITVAAAELMYLTERLTFKLKDFLFPENEDADNVVIHGIEIDDTSITLYGDDLNPKTVVEMEDLIGLGFGRELAAIEILKDDEKRSRMIEVLFGVLPAALNEICFNLYNISIEKLENIPFIGEIEKTTTRKFSYKEYLDFIKYVLSEDWIVKYNKDFAYTISAMALDMRAYVAAISANVLKLKYPDEAEALIKETQDAGELTLKAMELMAEYFPTSEVQVGWRIRTSSNMNTTSSFLPYLETIDTTFMATEDADLVKGLSNALMQASFNNNMLYFAKTVDRRNFYISPLDMLSKHPLLALVTKFLSKDVIGEMMSIISNKRIKDKENRIKQIIDDVMDGVPTGYPMTTKTAAECMYDFLNDNITFMKEFSEITTEIEYNDPEVAEYVNNSKKRVFTEYSNVLTATYEEFINDPKNLIALPDTTDVKTANDILTLLNNASKLEVDIANAVEDAIAHANDRSLSGEIENNQIYN